MNDQDGSGLFINDQVWSRITRTGQKLLGLVRNDQVWSGLIMTGQNDHYWLVMVRNDQDGQEWSGRSRKIRSGPK